MKTLYLAVIAATLGLGGCRDEAREQTEMYQVAKPAVHEIAKSKIASPLEHALETYPKEREYEGDITRGYVMIFSQKKDRLILVPEEAYRKRHPIPEEVLKKERKQLKEMEDEEDEEDKDCGCPY